MNALIIGMYVAEMLDKWTTIAKWLAFICSIASVILIMAKFFVLDIVREVQYIANTLGKYIKIVTTIAIISGFFYAIFPKKEVIYIAMGAKVGEYAVTEIAKSSKLQKISEILDKELDDILAKYEKDK